MLTPRQPHLRMPRLAAAALGLGVATCLTLVPGTAFAAPHGQGAAHAPQHAQKSSSGHAAVHLRDKKWQAQADPDGATNGGVDQPGGQGGTIGAQDGNNGSGNDADCEDDNRGRGIPGHCKTKPAHARPEHAGSQQAKPGHARPGQARSEQAESEREQHAGTTGTTPSEATPRAATVVHGVSADDQDAFSSTAVVSAPGDLATGAEWTDVLAPEAGPAATAAAASAPAAATPASGVLPNTGADAELLWLLLGGTIAVGAGARTVSKARQSA